MTDASSPPRLFLFIYFFGLIAIGTAILSLPGAWIGPTQLNLIDSFFTAVSAVCVTGLVTVHTADYSRFGQIALLILIQSGGLGIISFSTLYLILPRRRMSLRTRYLVQGYSVTVLESEPGRIIRSVVLYTLAIEMGGAVLLYRGLKGKIDAPIFSSIFHAVSAFCNAGFSLYRNSFESFRGEASVVLPLSLLVILGGLGFLVLSDIRQRLIGTRRFLCLHSRIVLLATAMLLISATLAYMAAETHISLSGNSPRVRVLAAFFQAVTTRTAGFSTIPQAEMGLPGRVLTLPLMLIGGSSGSAAGGIKVSTFAIILILIVAQRDGHGEIGVMRRKISADTLANAPLFALRAMAILFLSVLGLVIAEAGSGVSFLTLLFESVSAFATVGLSLGVTPSLSAGGKIVIAATMFAGRVGIIALAAHSMRPRVERAIDYPNEEVLIG